ncbi:hypothetical protein ACXHQN_01450 [Vibrio cincinnatiensis]
MFVFISMFISVSVLYLIFLFAKQKESALQRKYSLLVDLRQLLYLCRQHRQATHHSLMFGQQRAAELQHLQQQIEEKSEYLIATAHFDNKSMYRMLQIKLKALTNEWSTWSVARNQMLHGKAIRHCLFLLDEVMLAWLVESNREDLSDEYHMNWQHVLDSMDALTQLRICIEEMHTEEGRSRLKHYCDAVRRKLNQLALISPLSIASPTCSEAMRRLAEFHDSRTFDMEPEAFYQLTSEISLSIADVYDQMLADLTESLYLPLPKLVLA